MARNARNSDLEFAELRLNKEKQVNIQNLDSGENAYSQTFTQQDETASKKQGNNHKSRSSLHRNARG